MTVGGWARRVMGRTFPTLFLISTPQRHLATLCHVLLPCTGLATPQTLPIVRNHSQDCLQQGAQSSCTFQLTAPRSPHQTGRCSRWLHTGEDRAGKAVAAKELVQQWMQRLNTAQVPEPCLAAEHIVAHVLNVPRSELEQHSAAATLTKDQLAEIDRLMTCRLARMPLQYILGEWDFHSVTLKLQPPVFIPRPETEQLVELAIGILKQLESPRVLEIGCGSGAVSLALLHSLPHVECVAVDHSRHAIQLTEANAVRLGLSERLTLVDGKVATDTQPSLPHATYDLIVSNPPYVLRKDLMEVQPEIMIYEDLRALDGGKDGLEVIKAVLHYAHHLLPAGHTLLLEVDPCHPYLLPAWLEKQDLGLKLVKVHQDFCMKERFMEFVKTAS